MDSRSTGWSEVGDRCFARRYEPYDVTVGAILGADGVVLVDTRACPDQAREIVADLGELTSQPVRWVVNSHWHFDHTFGNTVFADASPAPAMVAHQNVPEMLRHHADTAATELSAADRDELIRLAGSDSADAGIGQLLAGTVTQTFGTVRVLDLGDRVLELVHPGRGHTAGDIVVRVHDADVVYVGDLVEASGPPSFGDDSHPLEWSSSISVLDDLLTADTTVVPGHGAVVDRDFVRGQRAELVDVTETIQRLWSAGVPEHEAAASGQADDSWPYPVEHLHIAIARGYQALRDAAGGSGRTLPIVG